MAREKSTVIGVGAVMVCEKQKQSSRWCRCGGLSQRSLMVGTSAKKV